MGQLLTCETTQPDRDVDQEAVTVRYRWFRNDKLDALSEGSPVLPPQVIRRGERWRCEAWSHDGTADSGRAVAEVVVQNSPPGAPTLRDLVALAERTGHVLDAAEHRHTGVVDPGVDAAEAGVLVPQVAEAHHQQPLERRSPRLEGFIPAIARR